MMLDALSHATLADIKQEGCCGRAYDGRLFCGKTGGTFRPLYRGRFPGSLATRCVGHSSSACKGLGRGRQTMLNGYPKDLSVKLLSYKKMFN